MAENSNEMISQVGKNIQEKAALVWSVAHDLVGGAADGGHKAFP